MPRQTGIFNPRPKKKKVQVVEAVPKDGAEAEASEEPAADVQLPTAIEEEEEAPPLSPGGLKRQAAEDAHFEALLYMRLMAKEAKEYEKLEKLAERVYLAKEARLDAGDTRKRQRELKNPWGRVRRSYEAIIEHMSMPI